MEHSPKILAHEEKATTTTMVFSLVAYFCPFISSENIDLLVVCQQGENDIEQLCLVIRVLGTPNEKTWPVSYGHSFNPFPTK